MNSNPSFQNLTLEPKRESISFQSFVHLYSGGSNVFYIENADGILKNQNGEEGRFRILAYNTLVNKQRYMNKFFESVNYLMSPEGVFIGKAVLLEHNKKKIYRELPKPLGHFVYLIYCILHRLLPKLPIIKSIYFVLTKGRFRAVSKMEIIGRLYSCGFKLTGMQNSNAEFWFACEKTGSPEFNSNVSYGPLVKLKRRGLENEFFYVYKLRTMYPYSEYLQEYVHSNYGLDSGGKFRNDPRVTTVGRVLRKYWIDEVPMILNILKGDMKLVGVRPLSGHYFSLYPKKLQKLRGKVTPGLLPPFYADMPKEFDEICNSEEEYLKSYLKAPLKTDAIYFWRIVNNILFKKARSN